eukprot:g20394.t1
MDSMFSGCDAFSQSLASWQVGNVKNFRWMFAGCATFAPQDLGSWNVNERAFLDGMFEGCEAFDCDLVSWNISDPKRRARMFRP